MIDGALYGVPWYVDTRVLFYRRDLLRAGGLRLACPATWDEWRARDGGGQARGGPGALRHLPADQRVARRWSSSALQAGSPLLRDGDTRGAFSRARVPPRVRRSTSACSATAWRPPRAGDQIANVYQEFDARQLRDVHHRAVEPRRVPPPAARRRCRARGRPRRCPGPTARRPASRLAGGSSLVVFRASRAPGRGVAADRVPVRARRSSCASTRSPATCRRAREAWRDTGARRRPQPARLPRPARSTSVSTPKVPEWEQIATKLQDAVEAMVLGGTRRPTRRWPRSTATSTASSRSAAGCSRASGRERGREARR